MSIVDSARHLTRSTLTGARRNRRLAPSGLGFLGGLGAVALATACSSPYVSEDGTGGVAGSGATGGDGGASGSGATGGVGGVGGDGGAGGVGASGGIGGDGGAAGVGGVGGSGGAAGVGGTGGIAGTGGTGGIAGTGGTGGTSEPPCDPTAGPLDNACVITEEYALFVSPSGLDTAEGTRAAPLRTIHEGLKRARVAGKRLYVCADGGTHTTPVLVTGTEAGVKVWGSFRCSDWSYNPSLRARVQPAEGPAFSAYMVYAETRFDGFEFVGSAESMPGSNSIAVFASRSDLLTIANSEIRAGDAQAGAAGTMTPVTQGTNIDGKSYSGNTGGAGGTNTCPGGSTGGKGGNGPSANAGAPGTPSGAAGGGAGLKCFVTTPIGAPNGSGKPGTAGTNGNKGSGATTWGTLGEFSWIPADGTNGTAGGKGQSAGGGAGSSQGGGGGGGAGGCGGALGGGGKGGGSSFAVLLYEAPIRFENVVIVAGRGGNGGAGHPGQAGLPGGDGGRGAGHADFLTATACGGGQGGAGGKGGGGGGGAGGLSVAILHHGSAPTVVGGSLNHGTAGTAGPGGDGNPGVAGQAANILEL
ncbi:MAG: hypothetical protein KIT72_00670 [Polyangiaceae bacterium]|nr:hypothetical protein [Polyangiaceae bacterium]MCW5788909.1 hypothetical protein [Polyangiaceae bacterium]